MGIILKRQDQSLWKTNYFNIRNMFYKKNYTPSCLIALAASVTACSGPSTDARPNIVMILAGF